MIKRFTLAVFFVFAAIISNAQIWVPLFKSGETGLGKIVFQDKDTGYALSSNKVLRTTDAGKTWNRILSSYKDFGDIFFADKFKGCIVGENDLVLITSDGGVNWQLKRTGNSDDDFTTVYLKGDTLFVLGPDDISTNKFSVYMNISYDRGNSWSRKSTGSNQSLRKIYAYNKDFGLVTAAVLGVFRTTNGWNNYSTINSTPSTVVADMAVIKDSVIIIVGNGGRIARSNDYGQNFNVVTSPTKESLGGVDFCNDTFGMISGFNGTILITRDAGLSWTLMTIDTKFNFYDIDVINPYFAWAVCSSPADSVDIFKFGSKELFDDEINFISGSVSADLDNNCIEDNEQRGPSGVLVKATPGPYYSYTEKNGNYQIVLPDTGLFNVECILPKKYLFGSGQCNTSYNGIYFSAFEQESNGNNFLFDTDTSVNLEIKVASARKRRCAQNNITLTYKNIGYRNADSVHIKFVYPKELISINATSKKAQHYPGELIFDLGLLKPNEEGEITIIDSVFCNERVRNKTVCVSAIITPKIFVKNNNWDTSSINTKIECKNDSIAVIKIINKGQEMKDSAVLKFYLDDDLTGELNYKIGKADSLRFEVYKKNKTAVVVGDISKHHPSQRTFMIWKEACGKDSLVAQINQVTKFAMQSLPSFESQICVPISDSYDPNDLTVIPAGIKAEHFIENNNRLNYNIRFQNTGNDTAYNIYILDTLPFVLNEATIEFTGSSHQYKTKLLGDNGKTILRIDFKDIFLVDSFTNEPESNGWISFDILPKEKLSHGKRIENFVDIYFDFNSPIRTNTVFVTIHDTIIKPLSENVFVNCTSRFIKKPENRIMCHILIDTISIAFEGKNKPWIYSLDSNLTVVKLNDTTYELTANQIGNYKLFSILEDCDLWLKDSANYLFTQTPSASLKDSLYCNKANELLVTNCTDCLFLWSDGSKQSQLMVDTTGYYSVILSNTCGMYRDSVYIEFDRTPPLNLGVDTGFCNQLGYQVCLDSNTSDAFIIWEDNSRYFKRFFQTAGTYSAALHNRCGVTFDTLHIKAYVKPVPDFELDGICNIKNTVFKNLTINSSLGQLQYAWNFNNEGSSFIENGVFSFIKDGLKTISLIATIVNNCSDSISKSILVENKINPNFTVGDVCEGDSSLFINSTVSIDTAVEYTWRFGDGKTAKGLNAKHLYPIKGASISYLATLVAKISSDCTDSFTRITSINALPDATFNMTSTLRTYKFTPVETFGDSKYNWDFGDGTSSIQIFPTHTFNMDTSNWKYIICLSIQNISSCKNETCQVLAPSVNVANNSSQFYALIYPNPVKEILQIDLSKSDQYHLEIVDVHSRRILQADFIGNKWNGTLSELAKGVYWIKISNNSGEMIVNKVFK